jgi:hypothetical protein
MKNFVLAVLLAGTSGFRAAADIKAAIVYDRGASAEVVNPVARENAVMLQQGSLPFSRITRIDFDFGPDLTLEKCAEQFKAGLFNELSKKITPVLEKTAPFAVLPGNLEEFLILQMKVQFWTGQYSEAAATAEVLKRRASPSAGLGALYAVLVLIEQGRTADAEAAFKAIGHPESVSAPMDLFIRARLAMAAREYRGSLQLLARIVAGHSRDPEWMPAATFYEGVSYKRTGYLEAAGNVSKELTEKYPGGYWSRRAEELK